MSLDTQIFIDMMIDDYLNGKWKILNDALIEAGALIAGGAVLGAYTYSDIRDIDIYIHASKAETFVNVLHKSILKYNFYTIPCISPAYDQSFFRRNNILARFTLRQSYEDEDEYDYQQRLPDIDIIILPDAIPILSVVKNFDLTFCEIWYDAVTATVSAVDPAGILEKRGMLKKDYVENMLVYLNRFTIKRVEKYVKRGYTISYDCDRSYTFAKKSKNVLSPEEWVVYKLYQFIVFNNGDIRRSRSNRDKNISRKRQVSLEIVCKYPLSKYTLSEFERILPGLKTTLSDSFLHGVIDNKILYSKILTSPYIDTELPSVYHEYIKTTLDLSREQLRAFYDREHPPPPPPPPPVHRGPIKPDVKAFDFSDVADDFNETSITNTTCNDLIMQDDSVNILEYLSEDADTFLFVSKNPLLVSAGFDALCFEKNTIQHIIKDKNNWFYECPGPIRADGTKSAGIYGRDTYVKIPNDQTTGLNAFIPLVQLQKILKRNHKIYYIEFEKDITHSIGWKNSHGPSRYANWVSANHCQAGSNILVYTLKVCRDPERCIKSLSEWGRAAATSQDDIYQDSLEADDDEEDRDEEQAQQEENEEFLHQSRNARLQLEAHRGAVYTGNPRDDDSDESDHDRDPRDDFPSNFD